MTDWDRCIHCHETGCVDGTVTHAHDCPFTTDLWPVQDHDLNDVCCACSEPFKAGDFYTHVKDDNHWMMANLPPNVEAGFCVCLGCAALDRKPT